MEFIVYLLKVNIAIILFYGFYRLFFQQDTFFQWKRAALLSILFISFLYPFGNYPVAQQLITHRSDLLSYTLPELIIGGGQTDNPASIGQYFPQLLFLIYALAAFILFLRILIQLGILFYKIRRTTPVNLFGQTVYESPGLKTPFSFFNWIVLDPQQYSDNELKEILWHEETHVRQGHSVDTVFSEILCAFCWFNPFIWLIKREIRMNLEFLADRSVLSAGCEAEHYQFHLLRLSYHKAIANFSNNFNVSPLKKRIFMMNKKQTSNANLLKYALLLPVVAVLVFFNSSLNVRGQETPPLEKNVEPAVVPEKKIYSHVDTPPSFPGGEAGLMEWLANNIRYPEEMAKKGTEGRVIVHFVVDETGAITDAGIVRSIDPLADAEALRVVNAMPNWIPGKQDGKKVPVHYTIPILFKLN
ncbi:MAG: M56 family metallopeptidase [Candidatus Symbiothrix sp.]|jgi:TonB family protein|nr:M56 family metallopeptidase [Candidatus Symbiothrix sp.]